MERIWRHCREDLRLSVREEAGRPKPKEDHRENRILSGGLTIGARAAYSRLQQAQRHRRLPILRRVRLPQAATCQEGYRRTGQVAPLHPESSPAIHRFAWSHTDFGSIAMWLRNPRWMPAAFSNHARAR